MYPPFVARRPYSGSGPGKLPILQGFYARLAVVSGTPPEGQSPTTQPPPWKFTSSPSPSSSLGRQAGTPLASTSRISWTSMVDGHRWALRISRASSGETSYASRVAGGQRSEDHQFYPCMMLPGDLRRVRAPEDERGALVQRRTWRDSWQRAIHPLRRNEQAGRQGPWYLNTPRRTSRRSGRGNHQ